MFSAIGIGGRLLLVDFPNVETIMAASIIAGAILGPIAGVAVALISVITTDLIIGNSSIMMFTWAAWGFIGLAATWAKRNKKKISVGKDTMKITGFALLSTVFFYLFTNFGVWYIGDWYASTWAGLLLSYEMGLPFLRNQILSSAVIVPVVSVITLNIWKYAPSFVSQRLAKLAITK